MSKRKARARCELHKFNSRFPFSRYDEIRACINIIPPNHQRFFIKLLRRGLISHVEHSYDETNYEILFKLIKPINWQYLRLKNRWRDNWFIEPGSIYQSWPSRPHWSMEKRYSVSPHVTNYIYTHSLEFLRNRCVPPPIPLDLIRDDLYNPDWSKCEKI